MLVRSKLLWLLWLRLWCHFRCFSLFRASSRNRWGLTASAFRAFPWRSHRLSDLDLRISLALLPLTLQWHFRCGESGLLGGFGLLGPLVGLLSPGRAPTRTPDRAALSVGLGLALRRNLRLRPAASSRVWFKLPRSPRSNRGLFAVEDEAAVVVGLYGLLADCTDTGIVWVADNFRKESRRLVELHRQIPRVDLRLVHIFLSTRSDKEFCWFLVLSSLWAQLLLVIGQISHRNWILIL